MVVLILGYALAKSANIRVKKHAQIYLTRFFSDLIQGYIVVQRNPNIVKGPYLNLEIARDELKDAKNAASRMMLEIFDGAIQNPNFINGIPQKLFDFDDKIIDMFDINAMVEIAKQWLKQPNSVWVRIQII